MNRVKKFRQMGEPAVQSGKKDLPKTNVQDHIGRELRAIYDDVLKEPIPDRFLSLLEQLEAQEKGKQS